MGWTVNTRPEDFTCCESGRSVWGAVWQSGLIGDGVFPEISDLDVPFLFQHDPEFLCQLLCESLESEMRRTRRRSHDSP